MHVRKRESRLISLDLKPFFCLEIPKFAVDLDQFGRRHAIWKWARIAGVQRGSILLRVHDFQPAGLPKLHEAFNHIALWGKLRHPLLEKVEIYCRILRFQDLRRLFRKLLLDHILCKHEPNSHLHLRSEALAGRQLLVKNLRVPHVDGQEVDSKRREQLLEILFGVSLILELRLSGP